MVRRSSAIITIGILLLLLPMLLSSRLVNAQNYLTPTRVIDHDRRILGAAWSDDGMQILSWDEDSAYLWDAASSEQIFAIQPSYATLSDATLSDDGSRLLTASYTDGEVTVWDVATQSALINIENVHQRSQIAWSRNGVWLASRTSHEWQLWNVDDSVAVASLSNGNAVRFSPDGNQLLVLGDTSEILDLNNLESSPLSLSNNASITYVAWSHSGQMIAGLAENMLYIFDTTTGEVIHQFTVPTQVWGDVSLVWGLEDTIVEVVATDSADTLAVLTSGEVIQFDGDLQVIGSRLSSDGLSILQDDANQILIRTLDDPNPIYSFPVDIQPQTVAWSADGTLLAFYNQRDQLMLWSATQNDVVFASDLLILRSPHILLWHPSDRQLITYADATLEVWDWDTMALAPLSDE